MLRLETIIFYKYTALFVFYITLMTIEVNNNSCFNYCIYTLL